MLELKQDGQVVDSHRAEEQGRRALVLHLCHAGEAIGSKTFLEGCHCVGGAWIASVQVWLLYSELEFICAIDLLPESLEFFLCQLPGLIDEAR